MLLPQVSHQEQHQLIACASGLHTDLQAIANSAKLCLQRLSVGEYLPMHDLKTLPFLATHKAHDGRGKGSAGATAGRKARWQGSGTDQQPLCRQSQPTLHKQSDDCAPPQSRDRGQLDAADGLMRAVSAQTAPAHKTSLHPSSKRYTDQPDAAGGRRLDGALLATDQQP